MGRTWSLIVAEAANIANSYATPVTLRQLHYRLVASNRISGYTNTQGCYKQLSALTAEARRAGSFPPLSDRTRGVVRPRRFNDPAAAVDWLAEIYRLDRTKSQKCQVWVLYEKATLGAQIESWTVEYGLPTAALRGYSSESLEREIFDAMDKDGRPIVVFYIGDLDPEGEDIERNFKEQADRMGIDFEHWEKLTIVPADEATYGLVPNPGKVTSSRAAGFEAKYGRLIQIEVEALDPAILRTLIEDAITDPQYFDYPVMARIIKAEERDIKKLKKLG